MSEVSTITELAKLVMRSLGKTSTVDEIYDEILSQWLYNFNTPTPPNTCFEQPLAGIPEM